ncbi:MAG: hypothetical protein GX911_02265 [Spirochaetales bacterium]|nr:hypothetical protein [Spirochaetales bacterium]
MKKKRHWALGAVVGVLILGLGVFLIFQEESFKRIFVSLLGVYMIGSGFATLLGLKSYRLGPRLRPATLAKALLTLLLGVVALILPILVADLSFLVLLYIIATELLFSGIVSIINLVAIRKLDIAFSPLIGDALISLILSLLLFFFPRQIGTVLLKGVGILVIAIGLYFIIASLIARRSLKGEEGKTIEGEAEILES